MLTFNAEADIVTARDGKLTVVSHTGIDRRSRSRLTSRISASRPLRSLTRDRPRRGGSTRRRAQCPLKVINITAPDRGLVNDLVASRARQRLAALASAGGTAEAG